MRLAELVREKRQEILRLAARHGASNVRIIGSLARGEEGPESDIDLLVEMSEDRSLLDRAGLLVELEELLGRKVDIANERGLRPGVRGRVLREAVPLWA